MLVVALMAGSAIATDYHYYSLGHQIDAQVSDSLVTVVFEPGYEPAAKDAKYIDAACIDTTFDPIDVNGSSWTYGVSDDYTIDEALVQLRAVEGIEIANPVLATPDSTPVYLTDEFTVRVEDDASIPAFEALLLVHNVEIRAIDSLDNRRYLLRMTSESAEDLLEIANLLYESDLVEYSVPNFYNNVVLDAAPNDEYYQYQWHLHGEHSIQYEQAVEFNWDERETVTVAIIDAGFDLVHEDIDSSRVIYCYDAVSSNIDSTYPLGGDYDVSVPPGETAKEHQFWGHGTNVLGLINAVTNNETGVVGIAPFCKFVPIKAWDDLGRTNMERMKVAFQWAAWWGWLEQCQILVAPWHMQYPSQDIEDGLFLAWEHNLVTFFPSGSDAGSIKYPGMSKYAIGVGATDMFDHRCFQSATGDSLDIVAPGYDIRTVDRMDLAGAAPWWDIPIDGDWNYDGSFKGTSASCAIAAGIAARILARAPEAKGHGDMVGGVDPPGMYGHPFDYIRIVLTGSADDMVGGDDTPCWDPEYGYGRVNAYKAMIAVAGGDPDNSGETDIDDVVYLIAYTFTGGPAPVPHLAAGDADCSGGIDIDDVVYLIAYIFTGGPGPRAACFKWFDSCM
jgi:hypothetical protein